MDTPVLTFIIGVLTPLAFCGLAWIAGRKTR